VTKTWLIIVLLFAATVALKAVGPASLGRREPSPRRVAVTSLLAPALLAGLIVYETLGASHGPGLTLDARIGGFAVSVAALALRLPLLAVVAAAALATALLRTLT
jgi:Branched-chain amino acid transport protein (AzlD)